MSTILRGGYDERRNHEHNPDIRGRWYLRLLGKDKSFLIERTETDYQ